MKRNSEDGTFHGGMVRDRGEGRGVRVARAKASEIPIPDPQTAQEAASVLEGTKQYPNIKSPLKVRSTRLACLGIPSEVLEAGTPAYRRCVRLANSYKKVRAKEYFQAHGFVSAGVGALLSASALALSGSRFIYEIASGAEIFPEERGQLGMPQLLKLASSLSDSARQNELSAWELCARESVVRRRNDQNNVSLPWVTGPTGQSGGEQRKPGRPRKAQLVESETPCLTPLQTDYVLLPAECPIQSQ